LPRLSSFPDLEADEYRRPLGTTTPHGTLGNAIKIAEFGSGEKMAPFVRGKFADRTLWITCIADEDVFPPTCHPYTCTAFAGAGDTPLEISRGRCIC
jgi:hypothetical protein